MAVSSVTEGEITTPLHTNRVYIRNKQYIHTHTRLKRREREKKKTLSGVTLVVLLLLLYTEQRDAEKRKKRSNRGTDLENLYRNGTES